MPALDRTKLGMLLECVSELQWIREHMAAQSGGVHDRLEEVQQEVVREIERIMTTDGEAPN